MRRARRVGLTTKRPATLDGSFPARRRATVRFSNFLFPESRDPARDGIVIDETLREARLSDELGIDVIWLAEHHFDGICAYVDPITFAGALATTTRRSK